MLDKTIHRIDLVEKDLRELNYYLALQAPTARALRTLDDLRRQVKELKIAGQTY